MEGNDHQLVFKIKKDGARCMLQLTWWCTMCPKRYKILLVIIHLMGDHLKIRRSRNKGLLENTNKGGQANIWAGGNLFQKLANLKLITSKNSAWQILPKKEPKMKISTQKRGETFSNFFLLYFAHHGKIFFFRIFP